MTPLELLDAARRDLLDLAGVAKLTGLREASVRRYVSQDRMPRPDLRFGGSPVWHRATIEAWQSSRPGQGYRSDRALPA